MQNRHFSCRTEWDFQQNAISREVARMRGAGNEILDLTESNPTVCKIKYPAIFLAFLNKSANLFYEPSALGNERARQAIAKYYCRTEGGEITSPRGRNDMAADIALTASTSEAYSFVLKLLVNPGENVLFPRPSYPLLDHLAQLNDVQVHRYFLRYDGQWAIDFDSVRQAITPRTRAIVLVNPNNPTGAFLKHEEWQELKKICVAHNLAVISDEVFADYAWVADSRRVATLAGDNNVLTFALGGISKMLGLPQMKLAWIAVSGPAKARRQSMQRLEMIADTYLSVNTPAQNALPHWMQMRRPIQKSIKDRIVINRRALESLSWRDAGCELLPSEGGWCSILRVPATRSEEDWVLNILKEKHVLVQPGYFFDFEQEAYLVLSLLPEPKKFQMAVDRIFVMVGLHGVGVTRGGRGVLSEGASHRRAKLGLSRRFHAGTIRAPSASGRPPQERPNRVP